MTTETKKPIILVKPKSISAKDKEKLTKSGHIVIETDYPQSGFTSIRPIDITPEFFREVCATCGEVFYMRKERNDVLRRNKKSFYCTQGHSQCYS